MTALPPLFVASRSASMAAVVLVVVVPWLRLFWVFVRWVCARASERGEKRRDEEAPRRRTRRRDTRAAHKDDGGREEGRCGSRGHAGARASGKTLEVGTDKQR